MILDIGVKPTTPCDEWEGSFFQSTGYGRIWVGGKDLHTHRIVMMQEVGHLERWELVCHRCDNSKCVRLDHLFIGTPKDNMHDMVAKGRHHGQLKTHCPKGHEYTKENTYIDKRKQRLCRTCTLRRCSEYRAKKRQSESQQLLKEQSK